MLHYTAMADCASAERALCNPQTEVSAHYLISSQGVVTSLVREEDRAWHAGAGAWGSVKDVNSRSIGIELSNSGFVPFAAPQMDSLESLLGEIMERWNIPPERVIGHSDCAPGRKIDPGVRFDWQRLALSGLSVWPEPQPVEHAVDLERDMDRALRTLGYTGPEPFDVRLRAFRARFCPVRSGSCDVNDLAMAQDLARRYPVD